MPVQPNIALACTHYTVRPGTVILMFNDISMTVLGSVGAIDHNIMIEPDLTTFEYVSLGLPQGDLRMGTNKH